MQLCAANQKHSLKGTIKKQALHEWINNWNDFADFEIISVITIINA